MSANTIAERAAARAQTRNEKEAVANLWAGYLQAVQTVALAEDEGFSREAARFRRKAFRYLAGLRLIVRGADILRTYVRVTGSNPWSGK